MVKGMNAYDEKSRRSQRRRNHYAKDLLKPLYHQRVVKNKKKDMEFDDNYNEE